MARRYTQMGVDYPRLMVDSLRLTVRSVRVMITRGHSKYHTSGRSTLCWKAFFSFPLEAAFFTFRLEFFLGVHCMYVYMRMCTYLCARVLHVLADRGTCASSVGCVVHSLPLSRLMSHSSAPMDSPPITWLSGGYGCN